MANQESVQLLQSRGWRHSGSDEHFQQNGGVANAARNPKECIGRLWVLFRQGVETVTQPLKSLSFVQNLGG